MLDGGVLKEVLPEWGANDLPKERISQGEWGLEFALRGLGVGRNYIFTDISESAKHKFLIYH